MQSVSKNDVNLSYTHTRVFQVLHQYVICAFGKKNLFQHQNFVLLSFEELKLCNDTNIEAKNCRTEIWSQFWNKTIRNAQLDFDSRPS